MPKLTKRQRVYFGVGKFGTAIFMQVVTIATVYIYGSAFHYVSNYRTA
ncbi:MAG: hypothetical protein H7645_09295 [Candidatus Heimdallarchaeota archaeon]|nr:hypothetical protein [Candidatus Heimdallarchaeota archaeon]MCK4770522.1 hypothetical protein [Candidatus Heimdallarchaeota archaeon]